jgi:hypothetical protein
MDVAILCDFLGKGEGKSGTPIAIGGNVEALAEIPLRREKRGRMA